MESTVHVSVNKMTGYTMLDTLVDLRKRNLYPFSRPDAVIPQNIIPPELRKDKLGLALFYFYACIYMRGGIESLQAFNALIKMWREHPEIFNPFYVQWLKPEQVRPILKRFVGWDSESASISWVENSRRLVRNWGGDPLNLLEGLTSYRLAVRRIKNKTTKSSRRKAGKRNEGFRGFQYKMVSMLVYFYDWEGWIKQRFLYPAPADFHNFRLALANGVLVVSVKPGATIRSDERLSAPWRKLVMEYLRDRGADPLVVADALWLFSLVMCGNSPVTVSKELKPRSVKIRDPETKTVIGEKAVIGLFEHSKVKEEWDSTRWAARRREQLKQTCLACVLAVTCAYAIPSKPYYRKGKLILRLRPRVEQHHNNKVLPPPSRREILIEPDVLKLIPGLEHPAAAE